MWRRWSASEVTTLWRYTNLFIIIIIIIIIKLKKVIAESESEQFFLKLVNTWQSYKQKRDCLVHFLRLLAVCWPGAQSAWDNHALASNSAKYSPI